MDFKTTKHSMKKSIFAALAILASAPGCIAGLPAIFDNGAGTVMYQKHTGRVVAPSNNVFISSNDLATVTAVNASNAVQNAAINSKASTNVTDALAVTNAAQDAAIATKVSTNEMGSGLTYTNGQWIVTSQGTVTNIAINAKGGTVSNGVATVLLAAGDIGSLDTNTATEAWTNISENVAVTNAVLNGVPGVVSNGMSYLTLTVSNVDLSGYATTGSVISVSNQVLVTLTNVLAVESNYSGQAISGRTGVVYIRTNAPPSDASQWATNPATATVNMNGYSITNMASMTVTGRLAIGFGVFADTNDVPAPTSSNTWVVYAVRMGTTNYLMGVDSDTNRTWIGGHP